LGKKLAYKLKIGSTEYFYQEVDRNIHKYLQMGLKEAQKEDQVDFINGFKWA
jgi:hypothetical protein